MPSSDIRFPQTLPLSTLRNDFIYIDTIVPSEVQVILMKPHLAKFQPHLAKFQPHLDKIQPHLAKFQPDWADTNHIQPYIMDCKPI